MWGSGYAAYLWQAGRAQLVLDETQAYLPAPTLSRFSHPPGRYLFATRETEAGSQLLRLDLEQCRAGDCQLALVDSLAVWSPAGTQTLVQSWSDQEQLLWRGDASGQAATPEAEMISPLYLFTLDSQTGELNWIPEGETTAWLGLEFSGDGRYLAVPGGTDLLLLDLVDGQTRSYASAFQPGSVTYDWSTDEAWVLLSGGNQLILAAPNHDYEQVIPLAGQSCLSGVWVSR